MSGFFVRTLYKLFELVSINHLCLFTKKYVQIKSKVILVRTKDYSAKENADRASLE